MLYLIGVLCVVLIILKFVLRYGVLRFESDVKLTGKVVIVTGANSGIGYHVAIDMAKRGARVILACRNEARGVEAQDQIVIATGNKDVVYRNLDLGSLTSVRAFCDQILATEQRLDVLVNNAGVFGFGNSYTADGIVEGMQINHYGSFLLTELLTPLLKKSTPSRIVMVSSLLCYIGNFKVDHINKKGYYTDLFTYSNSKLCNLAYATELSRRLQGTGVVVNTVHPGIIKTAIARKDLLNNIPNVLTYMLYQLLCWLCYRTAEEGAMTVAQACVDPALSTVSGKFLVDGVEWPLVWRCSNRMFCLSVWRTSEELVEIPIQNGNGKMA